MNHEPNNTPEDWENSSRRLPAESQWTVGTVLTAHIRELARERKPLSEDTARTIAAYLATPGTAGDLQSHWERFALTAEATDDLWRACMDGLIRRTIAPKDHRFAAWLALYAATARERMANTLEPNGDALCAYLSTASGIDDPSDPELRFVEFADLFRGTYASVVDLAYGMSPLADWESAILAIADQQGCSEYISFDLQAIVEQIRARWQVIPFGGQIHTFERPAKAINP